METITTEMHCTIRRMEGSFNLIFQIESTYCARRISIGLLADRLCSSRLAERLRVTGAHLQIKNEIHRRAIGMILVAEPPRGGSGRLLKNDDCACA
jgi:hypothetical protein